MTRLRATALLLSLLFVLGGCTKAALRAGDKAAAAGNWEQALAMYQEAAAKKPDDPAIAEKVQHARVEVSKLHVQRAQAAVDTGDLLRAIFHYGTALDFDPNNAQAKEGVQPVAQRLVEQGDQASENKDIETAAVSYRAVYRVVPDYPGLADRYARASTTFASQLVSNAREHFKSGNCANAMVSAGRALAFVAEQRDATLLVSESTRCLAGRSQMDLALAPVPNSDWFVENVIGHLHARIEFVPIGKVLPHTTVKAPGVTPLFMEVISRHDQENVDDDRRTKKIAAQSGRENPRYAALQAEISRLEEEIRALEAELDEVRRKGRTVIRGRSPADVEADLKRKRDELEAAKEELTKTDEMIKTATTVEVSYLVREVTRTAATTMLVRLEDPVIGRWDKTIEASVSARDTFVPAVPSAGIQEDPLELPSYETLLEDLAAETSKEVIDAIEEARETRRSTLIQRGRTLEAEGKVLEALEAYGNAVFLQPIRWDNEAGYALTRLAESDSQTLMSAR